MNTPEAEIMNDFSSFYYILNFSTVSIYSLPNQTNNKHYKHFK